METMFSFSNNAIFKSGLDSNNLCAVAKPTIPPPTIITSKAIGIIHLLEGKYTKFRWEIWYKIIKRLNILGQSKG